MIADHCGDSLGTVTSEEQHRAVAVTAGGITSKQRGKTRRCRYGRLTPGDPMTLQKCVLGLAAGWLSVAASGWGAGVATAQPAPVPPPPLPPAVDPLSPLNPAVSDDTNDEGGPRGVSGDFGRVCENWWVHCQ